MNCPFESSDVEPEVPADIVTNDSDSSAAVPSTQFSQRMRQPDAGAFRPVLCQGKQANFRSPPGLSRWFTGFCTTLVAPEIGIEVEEKRGLFYIELRPAPYFTQAPQQVLMLPEVFSAFCSRLSFWELSGTTAYR